MSRTQRHDISPGADWWSRRPLSGYPAHWRRGMGKWWKRRVHHAERRQGRDDIERRLEDR